MSMVFDQNTSYEERKKDVLDKDKLIQSKNKEIVKLRMENEELQALVNEGVGMKDSR